MNILPQKSEEEREQQWKEWQEYYRKCDVATTTAGRSKVNNYFKELLKGGELLRRISEIRSEYNIPSEAFARSGYDIPPMDWKPAKGLEPLSNKLEEICEEFALHPTYWSPAIAYYIFYNAELPMWSEDGRDICIIQDLSWTESYAADDEEKVDNRFFPIAIRVSPYASQRDIIDFIKKNYFIVKEYQEGHRQMFKHKKGHDGSELKIGGIRTRNEKVQERNSFIYDHRDTPKKELVRLIFDSFGENLDYAHVGKIISLEKKRREEN